MNGHDHASDGHFIIPEWLCNFVGPFICFLLLRMTKQAVPRGHHRQEAQADVVAGMETEADVPDMPTEPAERVRHNSTVVYVEIEMQTEPEIEAEDISTEPAQSAVEERNRSQVGVLGILRPEADDPYESQILKFARKVTFSVISVSSAVILAFLQVSMSNGGSDPILKFIHKACIISSCSSLVSAIIGLLILFFSHEKISGKTALILKFTIGVAIVSTILSICLVVAFELR